MGVTIAEPILIRRSDDRALPGGIRPAPRLWMRPACLSLPAHPLWEHARMDEQVIPILRVANAAGAVAWYERLGFT